MSNMKAAWIADFGGPEVLEIRQVPAPQPVREDLLVRVRASALNRADLLQRQGKYPPPPGYPVEIPGIEFAGEIAEIGSAVRKWKLGQRVFGLVGGAAHAEYIVTHQDLVAEIPDNLDWPSAAAVPEAFITAHDALWIQAGLRPGETVLINAVGSGVGLAAVQLVRAIHAVPYGTSRTPSKLDQAKNYGMHDGLVVRDNFEDLLAAMEQLTHGQGVNVMLDLVGGPYVKTGQKLLGLKGRMMLVGTVAGGNYELESRYVMSKRLHIRGTVLRARSLEEKIRATQAFASEVVPLLASGVLRPVIDSSFALQDIADAHRRLESNQSTGKVVIEL
ncbi:MAG TPA: NAD(P)H-quinone oxidoreductase [Candidatus Acidoferrales bacterium]|nr:NAD(P)H-quinone oxidoreductase [Candidatus Acidoferrales bacterium]